VAPNLPPNKKSSPSKLHFTAMFRLVASRSSSIRSFVSRVDCIAGNISRHSSLSSAAAALVGSQVASSCFSLPSSQHLRQFSSSHDDFSPQKKHNLDENDNDSEKVLKLIDSHVKANPIMLYMKGSPSQPMVRSVAELEVVIAITYATTHNIILSFFA
jgi:hypothetical protein